MNSKKLKLLKNKTYIYPDPTDPEFQNKIYKKREFYINKIPENKQFKNYEDIKKYRDEICGTKLSLYTHQKFLTNFINPYTPYKGLLIFHGVGTGKTGGAISIAENFKELVHKYNTKIYVLVPGPLLKEHFKDDIIKFTGHKYLKDIYDKTTILSKNEKMKLKNQALKTALEYYKIISHRSFFKKVLGEKIKDTENNNKKYKVNEQGEIERDLSTTEKIENLDNTLLIIDEAHRFTGNEHGDALKLIIKKSKNLRILLLTATPMKNLGDNIVELINFIRPQNQPLLRDTIFNNNKNYLMDFKKGGEEYLKKMCNGYVSYYRGTNPLLFAKKNELGEIPPGLIFTKCIRCKMEPFQQKLYNYVSTNAKDALDRGTSSVCNFVFPILNKNKNDIESSYGENGLNIIKSNLKTDKELFLKLLNRKFFNGKISNLNSILDIINNSITGLILKKDKLKIFSSKYYTLFNNLNSLFEGQKGAKTAFIYSNLVTAGINIIEQILLQNGYLQFDENQSYNITDNVIDYYTGKTFKELKKKNSIKKFYPATYIKLIGTLTENEDDNNEHKKKLLDKYFNNVKNAQGKYIKFVLGSEVMMEGITLENTGEVHISDVYYTLGRIDQVIGRAIRQCKHYKVTNKKNPYPQVNIYRYVVKINKGLSVEENLYRKAELKYLLIKKVERSLKEISIDCPINYSGNVFPNEIKDNKDCYKPIIGNKIVTNKKLCPSTCDFTNCNYKCYDNKLNLKYYNNNKFIYNNIKISDIDYNTYNDYLASNEIELVKSKIVKLYKLRYIYTLDEIINLIKSTYKSESYDLFENFFVYQALNSLIPITENNFNNFNDTIYDKYNIPGYLIYRGKYYIFQPFHENENIPIFYRKIYNKKLIKELSLYNYLKNSNLIKLDNKKESKEIYDFKSNKLYYENKEEFDIIGIIDYNKTIKKDVFKIREKRKKILEKKRGTGIYSEKGAICYTSKDKKQLKKLFKQLNIKKYNIKKSRINLCQIIKNKLLYLEKYSKNNITYMIIPYNHTKYVYPYNLEDRKKYINKKINNFENNNLFFNFIKKGNGSFNNTRKKEYIKYELTFKKKLNNKSIEFLKQYNYIIKLNQIILE